MLLVIVILRGSGWCSCCYQPRARVAARIPRCVRGKVHIPFAQQVLRRRDDACFDALPGNVALAKQACDVRVLAKAFEWAGAEGGFAAAANTAFNITNGDTMVWTALYPKIAALFGMQSAETPQPMELAKEMPK